MTEIAATTQDEKDPTQSSTSTKSKSKVLKQVNEGNDRPKSTEKIEKPPTKVVVRRLPPTMTLETFLDQVAPLPPVDYMCFVKADSSLAPNSFARAYLHFVHVSDLLIFTEKFDNYVFVDSKGNEYPAIVEYAPFQRIPKQRPSRKKDPRIGTIENDPYYLEFMEALKAEEIQRKSASKTNKQHFFETSTTGSLPAKVTSTPLLEFLKARRADKLRTKEDKIAERRKREMERRKARDDARSINKQSRSTERENDTIPAVPVIKIAGHGTPLDKTSKDSSDFKRATKDISVKEISKRREEDRNKVRDKDKGKDLAKEHKRDHRKDAVRDQGAVYDKDKDKENLPASTDSKLKETRKGGKSYQEERQRLNERRLAAKGASSKAVSSEDRKEKTDREEESSNEDKNNDRKAYSKKDTEVSSESSYRANDKMKNPDHRQQVNKEMKKYEKSNKFTRDQEQKRSYESRKYSEDGKDFKKSGASDNKFDESYLPKEETRKKSYNQEREQRRAADRKIQTRKDSSSKSEEKASEKATSVSTTEAKGNNETSKQSDEEPKGKGSFKAGKTGNSSLKTSSDYAPLAGECTDGKKKENVTSKNEEKDKKDPRAERRIRNKDRPSMEIYRPGMGRFSRQRLEREKGLSKGSSTERDSPSSSPSPVPPAKTTVISETSNE